MTESNQYQLASEELIREINVLKKRLQTKGQDIEDLKDQNLDLRLTLKEKTLQLERQESREEQLVTEINELKLKNKNLEDKFTNENIAGNNHIGLSRIDFIGGSSGHKFGRTSTHKT